MDEKNDLYPDLFNAKSVYRNLTAPDLYEHIVRRNEGLISEHGAAVVHTGRYTGRSPNDKFIAKDAATRKKIWWGKENCPISAEQYDALEAQLLSYLQQRDLYVRDCYVGADPKYRLPLRIITESAWHSLFAYNMFVPETNRKKLAAFEPGFTLINAQFLKAVPERDGTNSEAFVILNFSKRTVIIGSASYAGEIKKAIFTVMNYLLPQQGVLSMHCSANIGAKGDTALFFGLSGTGKTTLSSDPNRRLIGDDEHGWSENGVFNFENGCYAKVINLSAKDEPQIFNCTQRFGTILENVAINPQTRRINLKDDSITPNTRASYPLTYIPGSVPSGHGDHPRNIIMLTADAFGVMPPIAKMTPAQAMYHFISGYTAKVAGAERGITEPSATFSACFGSPFLPLNPTRYADLLGEKIRRHGAQCWLINTGWTNGPYGEGYRIKIGHTRAMVNAALSGQLDDVPLRAHPTFQVLVPTECPGVPTELLWPKDSWPNKRQYHGKAKKLARLFAENFEQFHSYAGKKIRAAAPITD